MGHELVSLLIPVLYRYDTRAIPRPELSQNKIISSLYFPPSRVYHYLKLPECLWPLYVYNPFEERHNTLILYSPLLPEFLNSSFFLALLRWWSFGDGLWYTVILVQWSACLRVCIAFSQYLQLLISSKLKRTKGGVFFFFPATPPIANHTLGGRRCPEPDSPAS